MTRKQVVAHWRKGTKQALRLAKLAHKDHSYALALFHCHLAVEKALKSQFIAEKRRTPPYTHDLLDIARALQHSWTVAEQELFDTLSDFAILARYGDQVWERRHANKPTSERWIKRSQEFISHLLP